MKQIKVSYASSEQLNWLVCSIENPNDGDTNTSGFYLEGRFRYSSDWNIAGPIIEKERISIEQHKDTDKWNAFMFSTGDCEMFAPTPLIAAMRCYVASKMGDVVKVPENLS